MKGLKPLKSVISPEVELHDRIMILESDAYMHNSYHMFPNGTCGTIVLTNVDDFSGNKVHMVQWDGEIKRSYLYKSDKYIKI